MKSTPFTSHHLALGAKMAEFAGFNMPISYTGINEEHHTVRQNAGVFDVSHMGEFILKGPEALPLIQRLTSNDASRLAAGMVQYSCIPNETGGIVDDLLVYCLEPNQSYMLVVNAGNIAKDWAWFTERNTSLAEMHDISAQTGLLAVQGPRATQILQPLTDMDLLNLKYYTFVKGRFAGVENVLISATGYTGAGGVEIYFEDIHDNANRIWEAIFSAGTPQGLKPIGLGARDTLRLEMGFCLYGNDIDDTTSPIEAGLGWITKFTKEFSSRAIFERQKQEGVSRKLCGIEMQGKQIARHGYPVFDSQGVSIGVVTSGAPSPTLGKPIGLAYLEVSHAEPGQTVQVQIRQQLHPATVVKYPFR